MESHVKAVREQARDARDFFVESPRSIGARTRAQRWQLFGRLFPDIAEMHVLDLGGTTEWWHRAPVRPASVTILNLNEPGETSENWLQPVMGDACAARQALTAAGQAIRYDMVFSNSLIEHVGGHAARSALADEVRALAPRHWVQTPYRYFPVEPHWLFPGLQFVPMAARAPLAARWPLAHSRPADKASAMSEVQWTELIGIAELRAYFPESEIRRERFAGLTKSIVATVS
jgi:hypothetical protein